MKYIPEISKHDYDFGTTKHLKKMFLIPNQFKQPKNAYVEFIMHLIIHDWNQEKWDKLKPRNGVVKVKALRVIHSLLLSTEPPLQHKVSGAAFLLHKWFII